MVNIKSSQRRSLFLLDRYYNRPRQVVNFKFFSGRQYSGTAVVPIFFMVLAMYNYYESIKRTLLPYSVQPNRESANTAGREILSPLVWEWHRYSSTTTADSIPSTNINHNKKDSDQKRPIRLLIAQYVGPGNSNDAYTSILDASSPVNRAYAKMHGHDYVILRGIGLRVPWEEEQNDMNNNRKPPPPPPLNRASFNKLTLLQHALASDIYDQLLILDSDAILYDFDKDVTDFLSSSSGSGCDKMVAGHKINSNDPPDTWHINNGVTLWNLRHDEIKDFVDAWESRVKWWIWLDNPYSHSDQSSFYATMRSRKFFSLFRLQRSRMSSSSLVLAVENDFSNGTIVHVMRPDAATWIDVNVTSRVETIQKYANEVCERYTPVCENIDANP